MVATGISPSGDVAVVGGGLLVAPPVIGPLPGHRDLHLATAHSMFGVTLAPTTAEVLAPVVLDGHPSPEFAPFSIARFAKRGGAVKTPTEEEI
jgi:D-amino-acid dehydrogenase